MGVPRRRGRKYHKCGIPGLKQISRQFGPQHYEDQMSTEIDALMGDSPASEGLGFFARNIAVVLFALVGLASWGNSVLAQPIDLMLDECARTAQNYFRNWEARTDMSYTGQRMDGTHAIGGRIYLETRSEDFACSYAQSGRRMVEFFAGGSLQNAYLPGNGGSNRPGSGNNRPSMVQVTGVPVGDVLNVRSEPSPRARIVGALSNGTTVRNLGCQNAGGSGWCRCWTTCVAKVGSTPVF
jgi:Bacterial SH3 domain